MLAQPPVPNDFQSIWSSSAIADVDQASQQGGKPADGGASILAQKDECHQTGHV